MPDSVDVAGRGRIVPRPPDPPRFRLAVALNDPVMERVLEALEAASVLCALRTTADVLEYGDLPADCWVVSGRLPDAGPSLPECLARLPAATSVLVLGAGRNFRRALAAACAARPGCRLLARPRADAATLLRALGASVPAARGEAQDGPGPPGAAVGGGRA